MNIITGRERDKYALAIRLLSKLGYRLKFAGIDYDTGIGTEAWSKNLVFVSGNVQSKGTFGKKMRKRVKFVLTETGYKIWQMNESGEEKAGNIIRHDYVNSEKYKPLDVADMKGDEDFKIILDYPELLEDFE